MRARRFGAAANGLLMGTLLVLTSTPTPRAFAQAADAGAPAQDKPAEAPKAPVVAATGYGYGDTKATPSRAAAPTVRAPRRAGAPVATLPGFEMLADGGSRLFVQVSKNVDVSERRGTAAPKAKKGKKAAVQAHPTITYVLKGAQVIRRNNQNALVTVHFNTPVMRARLVPAGRDVHFVVDLRADTTPSWKITPAKEGSSILQIDFPKGEFLPAGAAPPPEPTEQEAPKDNDDSN